MVINSRTATVPSMNSPTVWLTAAPFGATALSRLEFGKSGFGLEQQLDDTDRDPTVGASARGWPGQRPRRLRLLIGAPPPQAPVEQKAIDDGDQQDDRDRGLGEHFHDVAHGVSIRRERSPAVSNIAKVVLGLRSGFTTRTAMRSLTRPSGHR